MLYQQNCKMLQTLPVRERTKFYQCGKAQVHDFIKKLPSLGNYKWMTMELFTKQKRAQ